MAFQTASIARDLDGNWLLFGDALRTVRLPAAEMTPDISSDVVGYGDRKNERYIYLARNYAMLKSWNNKPNKTSNLRLIEASAPLKSWHISTDGSATLLFEPRGGLMPLSFTVPSGCALRLNGEALTARREESRSIFTIPGNVASGKFQLEC